MRILPFVGGLAVIVLAAVSAEAQCCGEWTYAPSYYSCPVEYEPYYTNSPDAYCYECDGTQGGKVVKQMLDPVPVYAASPGGPRYNAFSGGNGTLYGVNTFTGEVFQFNQTTKSWDPVGKSIP